MSKVSEEEFYSQDFEKQGVVSIWLGLEDIKKEDEELDVLQNFCGVGYYNLDDQESNTFDFKDTKIDELLKDISYSESFIDQAVKKAQERNIQSAKCVIVQYDFAYDLNKITIDISNEPMFLGVFLYEEE